MKDFAFSDGLRIVCLLAVMLFCTWSARTQPVFKQSAAIPTSGRFIVEGKQIVQAGYYFAPIDFDRDGIPDMTNRGGSDIYLMSYDERGVLNWIQTAGGTEPARDTHFGPRANESASGIATDGEGNIYIAGTFDDAADFDYDGISDVLATSPDTLGNYIAKYSADGVFQWVASLGSFRGGVYGLLFSQSRQSFYLASINSPSFLEGEAADFTLHLMELDLAGNILWEKAWHSAVETDGGYFVITDLTLGVEGNLYMTGRYMGTVDFDREGPLTPLSSNPSVGTSTFTTRYSPTGELQWVRSSYDTYASSGQAIVTDSQENVYVVGDFWLGDTSFSSDSLSFTGTGNRKNMFAVKYSSDGALQWAWFPVDLDESVFPTQRSEIRVFDLILGVNGAPLFVGTVEGLIDIDGDGVADLDTQEYEPFMTALTPTGSHAWTWHHDAWGYLLRINKGSGPLFYMQSAFSDDVDYDGPGGLPSIATFDSTAFGIALSIFELPDAPLPVSLTSYGATIDDNDVILTWSTASELNNAGFEILHCLPENSHQVQAAQGPLHRSGNPFIQGAGTTNEPHSYAYRFENLSPGTHHFRLKQIDYDGTFALSDEVPVIIEQQEAYRLIKAFPNPFNPHTTIDLSVAQTQEVAITLFDMLGRQVQTIHQGVLQANTPHQFMIDGSRLSSGTYFYQIEGKYFISTDRITLLK